MYLRLRKSIVAKKRTLFRAAVTVLTLIGVVALPTNAFAKIYITRQLANIGESDGSPYFYCAAYVPAYGSYISACGQGQQTNWYIWSAYPDAPGGAYANVEIQASGTGVCLTVLNQPGPGGHGYEVSPRSCVASGAQQWASTRSAAGYINFYNFEYGVCLDGGYSDTYGYPEAGCNAHGENHYQDWQELAPDATP